MGAYKKAIITEAGNQVLAKVVAGELTLNFSHARTSSYAYAEGTDYTKLTSLQDVKQEIIPSNVKVINDTAVSVRLLFGNETVGSEYLIQNIGLYVMDGDEERLFSVSAATDPDQMPAYDGVAPSSFIYNVSIPVSQAESLTLQINPAGAATTEDILELEADIQGLEVSKVTGDGGAISNTETTISEPTDEVKYPEITASGGTTKAVLGWLARWVKSLKADKVDASDGDIKDTKVSEFTASSAQWPVPAAGEAPKTLWGKVKKFFEDFKTWSTGVCLLAQLVSNTSTNNSNLPASAAAVYQLGQQVAQLNSDKLNKSAIVSQYKKLQINNVLIQFGRLECLVDYYGRASITFPESYSDAELYSCIAIPMAQNYAVRSIINNGANNSLALLVDNNGDYPEYQSKIWMQYIVIGT